MIDIGAVDKIVMSACGGLDCFSATFHADDEAEAVDCQVMRDTLELANEYGVLSIQSAAQIHYLKSEVGDAPLGSWFVFDDRRYVVDNRVATQDSNWRIVHCRVEPIP